MLQKNEQTNKQTKKLYYYTYCTLATAIFFNLKSWMCSFYKNEMSEGVDLFTNWVKIYHFHKFINFELFH